VVGWWPSAVALQGEAANHRKVRRLRAGVLSVAEKARHRARQVWTKKANASEPLMTCRNGKTTSKPGPSHCPGTNLAGACRLARWCPAWRRRELGLGSGVERGNLSPRARGWPVALAMARGRSRKGEPQAAETARG
jgi:hypothetical protein